MHENVYIKEMDIYSNRENLWGKCVSIDLNMKSKTVLRFINWFPNRVK